MPKGSVFNDRGAPSTVAALSNRLLPGRSVALRYEGGPLWHEAVLVGPSPDRPDTSLGWTWE
eukprot:4168866-Alexandrium_andersonii.AAC.1